MGAGKLAEHAVPKYARHETFAPRFGWMHKVYEAVSAPDGEEAFLRASAPVELGVGKNMVNSMRFWAQAFDLTAETPRVGTSRALVACPTARARWLLDTEHGVDPWLEDPGSLWLLHWWLLSPTCRVPTWWVAFNALPATRFRDSDLVDLVNRHVALAGWEPPAAASVSKDVDCFTKMYAPRRQTAGSPGSFEDLLDCPFRELGLLEAVPGATHTWRFAREQRQPVPPAIAAYACADHLRRHETESMTLARLAHDPGSPGLAFRLSEPALALALTEVADIDPELEVPDAGIGRRLLLSGSPEQVRNRVIEAYYAGNVAASAPQVCA